MTDAETQLARYFASYEPATAKLGKAVHAKLRALLPGLNEIVYVYENQEALVISFSPNENGYDAPFSLALHPGKVSLYFGRGAELSKSDPGKLLQGRGKTVRQVELKSAKDLDRPELVDLMAAAGELAKLRPDPEAKRKLIFKAEEQKQRARRAKKATKAAPKGRAKKP